MITKIYKEMITHKDKLQNQIKKLQKNKEFKTPVIAVTADAVSGAKERYLNEGFIDYLPKPFTKEQMKEKINKILGN